MRLAGRKWTRWRIAGVTWAEISSGRSPAWRFRAGGEMRAVWNRGQQASFEGLEPIWQSQPFNPLGVDSDNGGEFLNIW
jgi:hypothetical protein